MSIWMEIHCDIRADWYDPRNYNPKHLAPGCHSSQNNNIMGMTGNTQLNVMNTRKILIQDAEKAGWVFLGNKWICPHCQKALADQKGQN